jgi:hypothetical protein
MSSLQSYTEFSKFLTSKTGAGVEIGRLYDLQERMHVYLRGGVDFGMQQSVKSPPSTNDEGRVPVSSTSFGSVAQRDATDTYNSTVTIVANGATDSRAQDLPDARRLGDENSKLVTLQRLSSGIDTSETENIHGHPSQTVSFDLAPEEPYSLLGTNTLPSGCPSVVAGKDWKWLPTVHGPFTNYGPDDPQVSGHCSHQAEGESHPQLQDATRR